MGQLAHALALERNTVTAVVKRMEGLGLVSRSRHSVDERQVRVSVTDKGLSLRSSVLAMQQTMASRLTMPEATLTTTLATIGDLTDRITRALVSLEASGGYPDHAEDDSG